MRTNIELDEDLVNEALKLTDAKSKRELIHLALTELVNNKRRKNLMDLFGKIEFRDKFDYKKMSN